MEQTPEYFYNVEGFVRQTYPNGYGFLIPKDKLQPEDTEKQLDIYFHASVLLDEDIKWKQIITGKKVHIDCVVKTAKGYSAMGVKFIRPELEKVKKPRKNRTGAYSK